MKKILLCMALLYAAQTQADTLEQPNQAGGKIVLTSRTCPMPNATALREAYTYEASGKFGKGCWAIMDEMIHIVWDGGERSVFPFEAFTLKRQSSSTAPSGRAL